MAPTVDDGAFLPLERRTIKVKADNGVANDVPALHRTWMQPRVWTKFAKPKLLSGRSDDVHDGEERNEWMEVANFVLGDLSFLLALEHHAFWSQMVFDESVHGFLVRLLQNLPRAHDLDLDDEAYRNENVVRILQEIAHMTFLVFVRLCTHKESREHFISPNKFGALIYDRFLLDIPRLMDICILFHSANSALVEKMLDNVFSKQPSYFNDLKECAETVSNAMSLVNDRVATLVRMANVDSQESLSELSDLITYITDITLSVSAFLTGYGLGAKAFRQKKFESHLASFYSSSIAALVRYAEKQRAIGFLQDSAVYDSLITRLQISRKASIDALRKIIEICCLAVLFADSADAKDNATEAAESFLDLTSGCLSDGALLVDYNRFFPLQDDLEAFEQASVAMDPVRVQFLLNGVGGLARDFGSQKQRAEARQSEQLARRLEKEETVVGTKPETKRDEADAKRPLSPIGVQLDSLISQVKDLLPDLGEGYIEACLQNWSYDAELTINALLEGNLPQHLQELDRATARKVRREAKDVPVRSNVFDGDEFDINVRDRVDTSRIHKGKQNSSVKNANALLNDKSEVLQMKEIFDRMGMVSDEVDYDDEYDDTYDDNAIGQAEPDATDERRPFVLPRALGGGKVSVRPTNADEEEDDEDEESAAKRDEFVRNPEEVRAEAERKRRERQARTTGRSHAEPHRDVVGNAKGQGQSKQVIINRQKKTANKSKHVKAMADRKQAKGMF